MQTYPDTTSHFDYAILIPHIPATVARRWKATWLDRLMNARLPSTLVAAFLHRHLYLEPEQGHHILPTDCPMTPGKQGLPREA